MPDEDLAREKFSKKKTEKMLLLPGWAGVQLSLGSDTDRDSAGSLYPSQARTWPGNKKNKKKQMLLLPGSAGVQPWL